MIAALLAEVEQLRRRTEIDSSNSSMSPGSDGPAARATRAAERSGLDGIHRRPHQAGRRPTGRPRVRAWDRVADSADTSLPSTSTPPATSAC
ncbi:DUF6444 domain-containing protein [Nonomuraea angiospora]|uniref:DUF6444 domain-containing protein n=1 Tax=Nonomuraea angiospora TaxID=46172 RepID=UPI003605DA27